VIEIPRASVGALAVLFLAGCSPVGPDFKRPEWMSPTTWFSPSRPQLKAAPSMPAAEPVDPNWWTIFNDPQLTALVQRVAAENLDVKAASFRLDQSRAQLGIAEAAELPRLDARASYARQKSSQYGILTANPTTTSAASGGFGSTVQGTPTRRFTPYDIFQGGFDASWEIDLWGGVARSVEAATANTEAAAEARRGVLITTTAEVVRVYIRLRGIQTQLQIARDNLRSAQRSQQLTQARAAGGITTDLDVANASAQVRRTAAEIPFLLQREAALINALSFLLGQPPNALRAELETTKPIPPVPPKVPVGVPSDLVRRRPDLRQAEAELHVATAQIGVAEADFYPSVRLSGSMGLQALQIGQLFNLNARQFAVGPSITIPLFEGGRLRATLELRESQQQSAALTFQRVLLQAWHEVDDSLTAYQAEQARRDQLVLAVIDSKRAVGLAQSRYEQGVADFLSVLDSERISLSTQQQLALSTTNVSENLVALYKALGGGWETELPEVVQAPPKGK
jgi:NodT family efflux transporter outer membrane factor (OMF) lipoprotein